MAATRPLSLPSCTTRKGDRKSHVELRQTSTSRSAAALTSEAVIRLDLTTGALLVAFIGYESDTSIGRAYVMTDE